MKKQLMIFFALIAFLVGSCMPLSASFKVNTPANAVPAAKRDSAGLAEGYYKLLTVERNLDIGKLYRFEKADSDSYRLVNITNNTVITASDLKLTEQPWNGSEEQKWLINSSLQGYTIKSKKFGCYLYCSKEELFLKYITYDKVLPVIGQTGSEYFNLLPMSDKEKDEAKLKSISISVLYKISTIISGKVLQKLNAEAVLNAEASANINQSFKLVHCKDNTYNIQGSDSTVLSYDAVKQTLIFEKPTQSSGQKWLLEAYNQRIVLRSFATSKVLTAAQNGSIYLGDFDFTAATLWELTPAGGVSLTTAKPFTYFAQNDPAWSEEPYSWAKMRNAGCGPTSLAMITHYLSASDANPLIIARLSKKNKLDIKEPPRTDMDKLVELVTKEYEFQYKKITKEEIINELKQGRLVMMATWANPKINYNGHGHFLVLRGLDRSGNIIVNDPLAMNTYGKKAESYVENYKQKYVYVATPKDLYAKLFLAYSFWK